MKGNDRPLHRVKPLRVHHLIMRIITIVCTLGRWSFIFFSSSLCASRHRAHRSSTWNPLHGVIVGKLDDIYIYIFFFFEEFIRLVVSRLVELKKVLKLKYFLQSRCYLNLQLSARSMIKFNKFSYELDGNRTFIFSLDEI